jgi:hypothetical protein
MEIRYLGKLTGAVEGRRMRRQLFEEMDGIRDKGYRTVILRKKEAAEAIVFYDPRLADCVGQHIFDNFGVKIDRCNVLDRNFDPKGTNTELSVSICYGEGKVYSICLDQKGRFRAGVEGEFAPERRATLKDYRFFNKISHMPGRRFQE